MVLDNCRERFHYISGAFERYYKNPEKCKKSELVYAFKVLGRFFNTPYVPMETDDIWRL